MRLHAQSLQDLCHTKEETSFFTNKRDLKNIDGRQHVFVCDDFTPLRYKLLKYMQKSCSDTFTACYTRNGNMKAKFKTSEKWVTVTSPDDLFKNGIDVDINRWAVEKYLTTNSTANILPSVNSETKRPMQAAIHI